MPNTTPSNERPQVPVSVPTNDQNLPVYTPQQLSDYKAVMHHEVVRKANGDPQKIKDAETGMSMMAGGSFGKSALLNRIASGLWPLVAPPPTSHSYPWYGVVENDSPHELWLESPSAEELLKAGHQSKDWMRTALQKPTEKDRWVLDMSQEERESMLRTLAEPVVAINQSMWKVLRVVGEDHLEVTWNDWEQLGFVWRLSIDQLPAAESQQRISSWHNKELGRITTFEQLVLEQRWHVNKRVQEFRMAADPELADRALQEMVDADPNNRIFHQNRLERHIEAKKALIQVRLGEGKPAVPDEAEIEAMVQAELTRYLAPRSGSGTGWYSVAEDGSLILHTWRITRIAPQVLPESIFIDPSQLPRAES